MSPFDHVPRLSSLSIRRAEPEPLPPGWARRATALGPLPRRPRRSSAAAAPLLVVVDEHCLPQEGECLRSTSYLDCRRCLLAGLSRSRRPRAGPAGPLRWAAALSPPAVPQSPPLRSTAGGRRRALPGQTRHLRLRLRPPGAAHGLVLARPAGSGSGSIEVPYHHLLEAMLAQRWGPRPDGDGVSSPCRIGVAVH